MTTVVRKLAAQPRISRAAAHRAERRRLLVVCGGRETEPGYIEGLKRHLRNAAVAVDVATKDKSPSQVVRYAVNLAAQAADRYDEVWCIVDADQFTDLDEAVRLAKGSTTETCTVSLVVSNPCFELWLLLHFAEHRGHIGSYAQLKPLLRKHVPEYDKCRIEFARTYAARIDVAVKNARVLDPTGEATHLNPSTNMWRLVAAMGG